MNRQPEDINEDSFLRSDFVDQTSWDEWMQANGHEFTLPDASGMIQLELRNLEPHSETFDHALIQAIEAWKSTLDPDTNMSEALYLQGYDWAQRAHITEQLQTAVQYMGIQLGMIEEPESIRTLRELL